MSNLRKSRNEEIAALQARLETLQTELETLQTDKDADDERLERSLYALLSEFCEDQSLALGASALIVKNLDGILGILRQYDYL